MTFTTDPAAARRSVGELAGRIAGNSVRDLPVSGFRASGVGTENSMEGVLEFTRLKHIMVDQG